MKHRQLETLLRIARNVLLMLEGIGIGAKMMPEKLGTGGRRMKTRIREQLVYIQGMIDSLVWFAEGANAKECLDCIVGKICEILEEDTNENA